MISATERGLDRTWLRSQSEFDARSYACRACLVSTWSILSQLEQIAEMRFTSSSHLRARSIAAHARRELQGVSCKVRAATQQHIMPATIAGATAQSRKPLTSQAAATISNGDNVIVMTRANSEFGVQSTA